MIIIYYGFSNNKKYYKCFINFNAIRDYTANLLLFLRNFLNSEYL